MTRPSETDSSPDVGDGASNTPPIRRLTVGTDPRPLSGPIKPQPIARPRPPIPEDVAIASEELTRTTPWLYNRDGPALERSYLFPTPASAFAFVDAAEKELSPARRLPPHWAGCGRRVYVRFNSPAPDSSSASEAGISLQRDNYKVVSMLDVECALACDKLAQEAAARAGGVVEAIDWSAHMKNSKQRRIDGLSPVYPVGSWKLKSQRVWDTRERFWGLVRDQGWTSNEEDFWPAWAMVKYGVCVSRTRWKLTDDGSMGRLSISEGSLEDIANRDLGYVERSMEWQRQAKNTHGNQLSRTLWRVTYDALVEPSR